MEIPVLTTPRLTLRPLREADREPLLAMVAEPAVRPWWGNAGSDDYEWDGFVNEGAAFAIEIDGETAGWVGLQEETEPDYKFCALDISLVTRHQGSGLGPEALRAVIDWLIAERGHHRFQIDPTVANTNAIKAYERVGFKPVGILRQSERAPGGGWRDGLQMDLLAEELPELDR